VLRAKYFGARCLEPIKLSKALLDKLSIYDNITLEVLMGFCIKEYAFEQGMRLGDVARKLRMPLSNLSAVASGRRSVSLRLLNRIAGILGCSVPELFEKKKSVGVFKDPELNKRIFLLEHANYLGRDKTWVHHLMLAQRTHYGRASLEGS